MGCRLHSALVCESSDVLVVYAKEVPVEVVVRFQSLLAGPDGVVRVPLGSL